ncbi:MAG TPA: translocation/assembly module TamB domain-containing protein [Candidatus Margulisiibacteriota bacterium]|nr:translocation/assembly module TamB domain-containing protein [Candidatus Margulisiibacteriota bacterium]
MKRLLLACVVLIVCGAAVLWVGWPYAVDWLRLRLEREVSRATGMPSHVDELQVSLLPLDVRLGGITIGPDPALVQVGRIEARLWTLASVMEWRPVLALRIAAVVADVTQLPKAESPPRTPVAKPGGLQLPPLQLEEFDLADAQLRFRMGKDIAHLAVGHIAAHVETALVGHRLRAGVEVQNVDLERKSYRAKIQIIQAEGGADDGGLFVDHAALEGDDISVSARATALPHRHAVEATFSPGILGVVVDELSLVGGHAHAEGTLIGDLANPLVDTRLTIQGGAIGQHVLGDLDTHFERAGATLRFDDLRLVGASGDVTGAVDLTVVHEVPIHGLLTWHTVDLEKLLGIIGAQVPFSDRVSATTAVHGALDPLDLDVKGTGTLQTAAAAPAEVGGFDIAAHILPHDLDAMLQLTQAQHNRIDAEVKITGTQFAGTASMKAADLAALNALLPRPVPALALTGQGEASASFSGTTEHPVVSGTLALRNFTLLGAAAGRLATDFRIAAGMLSVDSGRLETGSGSAELNGVLALDEQATNDWRVRIHDLSNAVLLGLAYSVGTAKLPIDGGMLNGTLDCKGSWRRAETSTNLVATGLRIMEEPLEHVEMKATTTLPRWTLFMNAVRTPSETLTIEGAGEGDANVQLSIDSTPLSLATVRGAERRRLTGVVTLQGRVSGALRQPSGALQLSATGLGAGGHQLGDLSLHADGTAGAWSLKGTAFAETLTLDATLRMVGALPLSVAVVWNDSDLSQFVSVDRSLSVVTSGSLNVSGALRAPQDLNGSLRMTRFDVRRDAGHVELAEPVQVRFDKGHFHIDSFEVTAAGSRLSVAGEGRLPDQLNIEIRGEGDLVLLEVIGQPFYSARGQFGITAHIEHSVADGWKVRGEANLRNAGLDLGLPVSFTDTNGEFLLLGSNVLVQHLAGRAGGGRFRVTGIIRLPQGPELSWSLRDVGLTFPEWLEERVSGEGQVQGTWQDLTVSGDVEVLNAVYDKKIELNALIPWFKEQITPAPRTGPPAPVVRLDLHIHAPDGLFVDNNIAKAELSADLRISGTATNPLLNGTVEILSGEATINSRVFTISGGSAVFQPSERINPVLNFNAESRISGIDADYTVRVAVNGTLENPRVEFTSDDPALSQNDVLSLVALGRTTHEQPRDTSSMSVGNVLSLLPSEYGGEVSQQVRTFLRIDRFEVDPAYVRTTGTVEPRITIGKDLTDRIRALASSSFGADARNTAQLEYRITGRISLLATWESASQTQSDAVGGDIKFRYEFRRVRFSLLNGAAGQPQQIDAP